MTNLTTPSADSSDNPNPPAPLTFTIGARTDTGMQRSANEDAVAIFDAPGANSAFIVADGMGGLRSGDIASQEAIRVVEETVRTRMAQPEAWQDPLGVLSECFVRANDAVNALGNPGASDPEEETRDHTSPSPSNALAGTTCIVGLVRGNSLYMGHVGDSRVYLFRDGSLIRLTEDHSFVADRVRAGDMTEAEARSSKFRNMITRAVGIEETIHPDLREEILRPGDTLIACSDGLTTMMEDEEIAALLASRAVTRLSPERAASALVDAANKKGGSDNITVVLLRAHVPGQEDALAAPTSPQSSGSPVRTGARPLAADPRPLQAERPGAVPQSAAPAVSRSSSSSSERSGQRRRSSGPSPFLWPLAIIGLAAVVGLGGLTASQSLRTRIANSLAPVHERLSDGLPVDFANLQYERPMRYGPEALNILARGDMLEYSGSGLCFAASVSGKVTRYSPKDGTLTAIKTLPPLPENHKPSLLYTATDAAGNLYISDPRKKSIEKIGPDGKPLLSMKGLLGPESIAVDEKGNIYVVDFGQIKILKAVNPGKAASPKPGSAAKPN